MGRIEGGAEGEVQGAGGSRKWYKAYKNSRRGGVPDRPEDLQQQWRSQMSGLRVRSMSRTARGWGPEPAGAGAGAGAGWDRPSRDGMSEPGPGAAGQAGPMGQGAGAVGAGGAARAGGSGRDGGPPGPGPGAHEQAHSARRRQASGAQGRAHVTGQVNDLKDVAEDRSEAAEARERGRAGDGGGGGRETSPKSLPPPPEHPLRGPA